jgi:hypothetical protein
MEYTIDITEYSTRSQLRAIADEANRQESERKRYLGLLQNARETAEKAARAGKYEMRLMYAVADADIMLSVLRRALVGCSITLEQQEAPATIHVSWT